MNAYDMANEIQDAYCEGKKLTDVANMLRQQADRMAELEKYLEAWKLLNNGMIELGAKARKIIDPKSGEWK